MTEPPVPPPGGGSQPPDWGEMRMKLRRAQGPNRVMLVSGVLFFVDSFLPWYGVGLSIAGVHVGLNAKGWGSGGLAVIAILLGLAATVLAAIEVTGALSTGNMSTGTTSFMLAGGAFAFVVLRLATETNFTKFGLYLALVLTAVMAYAGWQNWKATS